MKINSSGFVCFAFAVFLHSTDAAITEWTTPTIASVASGSGTLTVSESQAISTTITTYVAVTDASTVTYALGSAVSPFALSSTGVLTITANLDADTTASYTLDVVATDDATPAASGTATIAVTVTDVDVAPEFGSASYTQCIADGSAADTTLITVLATDSDPGDTITHSINSGDSNSHFKIDASTGVIQVNTGETLAMATTASYTLVIHGVDNESPAKTGSTTVSVTVAADCNNAAALGVSVSAVLVTMLMSIL
ncbi:cadherin-related tumor suppressor-like [Mercenaria mercenaria]|uniref:cadherin-related tumor suppressor-like n=1 Tax=Mercenaria mercenaria TaxID=6596 RepID=UPI00234F27DB|nr:cadherin-related tumor suppressor-like [Mercenaria mercenaria]